MKDKTIELLKKLKEPTEKYIKKKWWYILLVIASSVYVTYYRYEIYEIKQFNARSLIFIIWLILLALPLFSEIEIGNIKIKKEVEKVQKELKEGINDLRLKIMRVQISNSNTLVLNPMPSEDEIAKVDKKVKKSINDNTDIIKKLSETEIYLFAVRKYIESKLTYLCERFGSDRRGSIFRMLEYLIDKNIINYDMANKIKSIVNIANRSIHGEIVDEKYINYVKNLYPEVEKYINSINEDFPGKYYFVCSRCHYNGPSKQENVCPKCGFATDEY